MANRKQPPTAMIRVDQSFADYLKARADREGTTVVTLTRTLTRSLRNKKGWTEHVPASLRAPQEV